MNWESPQGIEVLVKKASVDPEFAALLLANRAEAAEQIGLVLDPAEATMLAAVPDDQLEAIIAQTTVPQGHRRAFLGKAAAAMLAALGAMGPEPASAGVDRFRAGPTSRGIRPDRIPVPEGIRPDPATRLIEARVIAVVAKQLGVPRQRISRETALVEDLHADAKQRQAVRKALEKEFAITIPGQAFEKLRTVGKAIDYVELTAAVEPEVIKIVAKRLDTGKKEITLGTSLVGDLQAGAAQLAQVRRDLAREFRISVSWEAFKKLQTVGQVVDYVRDAVEKRQAAAARKKEPVAPRGPGMSMGIRPGSPPRARPQPWRGLGGIRPG